MKKAEDSVWHTVQLSSPSYLQLDSDPSQMVPRSLVAPVLSHWVVGSLLCLKSLLGSGLPVLGMLSCTCLDLSFMVLWVSGFLPEPLYKPSPHSWCSPLSTSLPFKPCLLDYPQSADVHSAPCIFSVWWLALCKSLTSLNTCLVLSIIAFSSIHIFNSHRFSSSTISILKTLICL